MKVQVSREGDAFVYKVTYCSGISGGELRAMYFDPDETGLYRRIYPACLMFGHDGRSLETNYNNYLLDLDKDKNGPIKDRKIIDAAIGWICSIHEINGIKWWLAGSAALYARGLDVWPHDIDVMTYKTDQTRQEEGLI